MRSLSQIVVLLFFVFTGWAQTSPHGGDFDLSCENCHATESWDLKANPQFDHQSTGFALNGEHKNTDCKMCHANLEFSMAQPNCNSCHTDMHASTVGQDCERCHNERNWMVLDMRQKHLETRFPLEGVHKGVDCFDCHHSLASLRFDILGTNCIDCHQNDYLTSNNPNHVASGFLNECTECHNASNQDWKTYQFDHSFFELIQGHAINDCNACHSNNNYVGTNSDCYACHNTDYLATSNPSHVQSSFSTECQICHTTAPGWQPVEFKDHDLSYFPVYSGVHNNTWDNCNECHITIGNYTQNSCIACHEHNKAETDKEHGSVGGYTYNSASCLVCHPNGSADEVFNHSLTNFPLVGEHQLVDCDQCHTQGYQGTSTECYSCHATDYLAASNPSHVSLGLSTSCEECHTPSPAWQPATFAIHDSYYPLVGGHTTIKNDCKLCHTNGYENTPTDCYACHNTDYLSTTSPSHSELGFSTDCETCHTVNAWSPSDFNHDEYWVLTGQHANIKNDCIQCHSSGYTNTSSECYSCHQSDYNRADNHLSDGFPKACEECHTTSNWQNASFNHDSQYFPIYSGEHRGEWNSCTECHTVAGNFSVFSCTDCHEHNKNEMDDEHDEVRDYSYNSTNCYACHPRGDD